MTDDPKLTRSSVLIKYHSDDKYRMEWTAASGGGKKNLKTGEPLPPQLAMMKAVEELGRITALFGFAQDATIAFESGRDAAMQWLSERKEDCK